MTLRLGENLVLTTSHYRDISKFLNTNGEFDEEGRASGFVVPYPNISTVIGDDRVDNGQP